MKNIKFAAIVAAVISMLSFSSCLSDSSSKGYDVYADVSLKQDLTTTYFITDAGIRFYPENAAVLSSIKLKDGSYLERFVAAIKLSEGEIFSADKKSYKISEVAVSSPLIYKPITTKPDTIKGDYGIYDIHKNLWAANGYINVPIYYYYSPANLVSATDFNVYATGADKDTLFLTLQQSRKIEQSEAPSTTSQVISFSMPFGKYEFESKFNEALPLNDSIVLKITAKAYDKETPIVRTTKYRFLER